MILEIPPMAVFTTLAAAPSPGTEWANCAELDGLWRGFGGSRGSSAGSDERLAFRSLWGWALPVGGEWALATEGNASEGIDRAAGGDESLLGDSEERRWIVELLR